ncbi:MAG TPA: CAP domain-containing protein [Pyrinomonadaceae bacterium]|nr:CAP domain-containing protein [Pyrinomonadaceae bacterium]
MKNIKSYNMLNFVNRISFNRYSLNKIKLFAIKASVILISLIPSSFINGQINSPDNHLTGNYVELLSKNYKSAHNPVYFNPEKNTKITNLKGNKFVTSKDLISELEHQVFDILNKKRIEAKLLPMKWNEEIANFARLHSEDMAKNNYFSNIGLSGSSVTDRAYLSKFFIWKEISEIIGLNQGHEKPAESACKSWLDSPSYSQNILNKKWTDTGVGIAMTLDGTYYFTQVFILK